MREMHKVGCALNNYDPVIAEATPVYYDFFVKTKQGKANEQTHRLLVELLSTFFVHFVIKARNLVLSLHEIAYEA